MTARRYLAAGLSAALLVGLAGCAAPAEDEAPEVPELAPFLIDQDFPDPDVIVADSQFVAFATNAQGLNVQVATADDPAQWTVSLEDALPDLPVWAAEGRTWAPDVSEQPGGGYVLYFTAQDAASNRQCIGAATSDVVTGPFVPAEGAPIVCTLDEGGAIDASTFTDDDGTRYLVWKNDGNCCGFDTWIQLAPLSDDGLSLTGPTSKLFAQTEPWEGQLVEAPVIVERDGSYVVFYSANDYSGENYAMGVATSPTLTGPYEKSGEPFLSTESSGRLYLGPGGQDVVSTPEGDILFFHGWSELVMYRGMLSAPLEWDGDVPSVQLP